MPRIQVHAKPGSRTEGVELRSDGVWVVRVRAAAVDGKANERLCKVLAEHLGCRPSAVRVISGTTGRRKIVEVPAIPSVATDDTDRGHPSSSHSHI